MIAPSYKAVEAALGAGQGGECAKGCAWGLLGRMAVEAAYPIIRADVIAEVVEAVSAAYAPVDPPVEVRRVFESLSPGE